MDRETRILSVGSGKPAPMSVMSLKSHPMHTIIITANRMNNQINSISPKYWGAFKELALGTLNYGWNQMSNEILYWTGN